jgi:acetolactate synthase small subunit
MTAKWRILRREILTMDVRAEIAERVARLSPLMQEQVLLFVSSLEASTPKGENGAALRRFAGSLDDVSAREMIQAIEEECERVDAGQW